MNFLSHLYLSGNTEGLIIGNFIADSVKGSDYKKYSPDIQQGIILHRKIDTFTDAHIIVEESKKRLRTNYKKYAGVIVDIYYDHFLASAWSRYSDEDLNDYASRIYNLIEKNKSILPLKSQLFKEYMIKYNVLNAYSNLHGIERVLQGMSRRTTFVSNMQYAINDLKEHYELFENEFHSFFPELQNYVKAQIEK